MRRIVNSADDETIAQLRELCAEEKRKIATERQRFGGKYRASVRQKAIASVTIQQVKPWQQSTGPKTPEGKARSRMNAKVWLSLQYSAASEAELDTVTAPVEAGLQRFRKAMKERGLGCVKITGLSVSRIRFKHYKMVSTFERSFQVKLSK